MRDFWMMDAPQLHRILLTHNIYQDHIMRRRGENRREVPEKRAMDHALSLSDSLPMPAVPRESELKLIFEPRELSMEPKCKYRV